MPRRATCWLKATATGFRRCTRRDEFSVFRREQRCESRKFDAESASMRARSYCARGFAGGGAEDGVKEVGGPAAGACAVGPGGAATLGCGCAAAIVDAAGCGRAPTSSGSGSRKALRKPTSDCWRDSAEAPDVEEELGLAAGAGAEAETTLGCGAADDAG